MARASYSTSGAKGRVYRGVPACDQGGFHVQEYVDDFIESAEVLLGVEMEGNVIRYDGGDTC